MNTSTKHIDKNHNIALYHPKLLREADRALRDGREKDAIYYATEALCAGIHNKFDNVGRKLPQNESSLVSLLCQLKNDSIVTSEKNPTDGFESIYQRCKQVPEQWSIVQINKSYTPHWNVLTHRQLLQENTSIDIVLFTYPNSEIMDNRPIMIRIDPPNDPDFYSNLSLIPEKVKHYLIEEIRTGVLRHEEIEAYITSAIDRLTSWLGPWIVLFSGKFSSTKNQQLESEIFNRVEDFCILNKHSKRNQLLISLVARRLDMIDQEAIYRFSCEMTKVNTNQEFSRLGSFRILWQLYIAHHTAMSGGYLRLPAKKCHTIINPDNSLPKMSARLRTFYKEWYPDFKLIADQPPADGEFTKILQEADVMIYNGHGSGLQFIDGDTILQHDIKSLIFLMGCDSVRLHSNGLFSEMTGSHLYYNIGKCAAVVGSLWVLTDFYTDYYSILLVAGWIPTANPKFRDYSVIDLDPTAFKHGMLQWKKLSGSTLDEHCDDNLLRLLTVFRRRKWLPKRIRYAMVCRGLPVVNATYSD
ncbi:uncharacterized protein LOC131432196 isoform X2 [Malaya genurostris]|uniref:uncharacterized protein LOC131432196 isoform X2 n=1 Tax=Malaya genurostris TaxID=325434 RepID=UPI0026F3BB22|nr:uncharacterized protein LOC131432196 isoform X2 [Malaya genurostris]